MVKWSVSKYSPEDKWGCGIYTAAIDYDEEHWAKIEIHDVNPTEALRLAQRIAAFLNKEEGR